MKPTKILILSQNPTEARKWIPAGNGYQITCESSAARAKQRLQMESFTYVILVTPLCDEFGIQTANQIASVYHQYVLLLVPRDKLDQATYQTRDSTVFTASLPVHLPHIHQALTMLEKFSLQNHTLEEQLAKARQKLQDEKMVTRCKLMLIEHYHWSEEKAHSYLGKAAMDHSTSKANVARVLLNRMEARSHLEA